jgi:hypothetical protein
MIWKARRHPGSQAAVPDKLEPISKRVALAGVIVGMMITIGSGVSSLSSRLAVVDEKIASAALARTLISVRVDKMDAQQSQDEQAEHSHYNELLKHAVGTETDVRWIMRALKK